MIDCSFFITILIQDSDLFNLPNLVSNWLKGHVQISALGTFPFLWHLGLDAGIVLHKLR